MDKESLLTQIKTALEELLNQTQKLEKREQPPHQIDKDLLLEKTRSLYEQMMALEDVSREEKPPEPKPATENETPAELETEEKVVEKEGTITEMSSSEVENSGRAEPNETAPEPKKKPEPENMPKAEEMPEESRRTEVQAEKDNTPPEKEKRPVDAPKTTLDLFSEAPPETLGDSLTSVKKPVLADSLQMNGISDLREAIGINDKFLFINELFNGDLERYNKVIDELNGFSGLSGVQTYLTELQVQYQWDEQGSAYQKLNILLERKFV